MAKEALLAGFEARAGGSFRPAVERVAAHAVDDTGEFERQFEVLVNDRPGIGIGVVDLDLFRRQLVFEDVVLDPGEAQRARGVEPGRLEVAGDQLHCRDPARADLGDELLAIGECGLRSPQPEADRVGKVVDLRRAGGRGIEHTGAGQVVLEQDPGDTLLRTLLRAQSTFPARHAAHFVGFVERDDAFEGRSGPAQDLLEAGGFFALRPQGRVGDEQHAFA